MSMSLGMVTVDTTDVTKLAGWWAEQAGWTIAEGANEWYAMLVAPTGGAALGFQKVEDPTPGKNRLHLDVNVPDREAAVARLLAAGATMIGERSMEDFTWTTLADPDGNQFCVAQGE